LALKMGLFWVAVPAAPAKVSVSVTCPVAVVTLPPPEYCTPIVQLAPAATAKPDTHRVPDPGATIVKFLVAGPVSFVTVGLEASVIVAPLLLVTVIVPEWAVVLAGVVKREGAGPENPNVTAAAVPVKLTGEPVTSTLPVMVTVPVAGPAAVGENTTLMVQVAPATKVAPQKPPNDPVGRENGAVTTTVIPVRFAVPVLWSVRVWAVLVVPTT
jgi:hypothetical protein